MKKEYKIPAFIRKSLELAILEDWWVSVIFTKFIFTQSWGFFRGVTSFFFQSHYNDPNDCMNHPKWLFGSC